jgi:uroporphyrinogen decarboxylase
MAEPQTTVQAPLKNDRFLRALLRESVDVTPVWMMRQAGRYLPEYRATRAQAGDFLSLCKNRELACEVTLQPLERFDLDAAILFSDILTIPDAMDLGLYFEQGEGPRFKKIIRTEKDVSDIVVPNAEVDLDYVMNAVTEIRGALNGRVPLIGFSGSPWTLATYMVEGGSSKDFRHIKKMMYAESDVLHALLDKLAQSVTTYLNAQIRAGAQAVQIFDTWGGVLSREMYQQFSLAYMERIVAGLIREHEGRKVPVIMFTKNGGQWLESMAAAKPDALGVDWTTDIGEARQRVGGQVALQGNMDPSVLYASPERIRAEVADILERFGPGNGQVFNLGHGIHQFADPDHAKVFVDAVHELSAKYHA